MNSASRSQTFRKYHRMLGFFLAGILTIYAFSGVILIYRKTDTFKVEKTHTQSLEAGLSAESLAQALELKALDGFEADVNEIRFENGRYDIASGELVTSKMEYPFVLKKLLTLHKATTKSPLYFLNIFFGASVLFFAVSAFFMFLPNTALFRSSVKIAAAGAAFALLVVIFS